MRSAYKQYPICDTDIWVKICLVDYCDVIFAKYPKIFFSDVVEKEILKWDRHTGKYRKVAENFEKHRDAGNIVVIHFTEVFSDEEQLMMENEIYGLDFKYSILSGKGETDKGEFVSALYAFYLKIPFMKTDDSIFDEGRKGNKEFPDLKIKKWYEIMDDLCSSQDEKMRVRRLLEMEKQKMDQDYEELLEKQKREAMLRNLQGKINNNRL
ncbi:hypothetical protein [Planococcus rifietoensis]|uniref:hypothetical protein n=1 Tax=Planococcus rifietoensis TaxID=200991 RepID=UPI00384D90E2